ncbi:SLC13 family permease [Rariglobus hedericola]|uniref:SLC13 family permease n=1 Tax=Rariglobus hedericola TaxID=2597822 RepID=A0A556QM80_9BACT|nr:SLC13 family permease [Rariglobus hedericola]TSJ77744.1 SLC13 family permease [Rariglobus hedericola]
MTREIAIIFVLLAATMVSFMREKIAPDITALMLFVAIIATGLLSPVKAFSVFANPAPFTVGAMFVLSAALVRCGAIELLSGFVEKSARWSYPVVMFILVMIVAIASAFINNTPVVVVFLPVVLGLARKMNLAPSKLLIPLSYAAVLGGTCTLIGTSTNLVVNGILISKNLPAFSMFELAWLGVPATLIGAVYLAFCGKRLLPTREMLTSILTDEERREYITEAFVQSGSPAIDKTLIDAGLTRAKGIRIIEIVRNGVALYIEPEKVLLKAGDRIILACRPQGIAATRGFAGIDLISELKLGIEQIAAHEGSLVEAVVNPHSGIVGHSVREVNFRQRFRMIVLAVHRKGRNVRERLDTLPLEAGDIVLMMGTDQAIDALRQSDDLMLFDRARVPATSQNKKMPIVLGVIAAVVTTASFNWVPIEVGALAGCVIVCLTGCLKANEAYASIEWNILFLIYGMLAAGLALEQTGAALWLAGHVVDGVQAIVPPDHKAIFVLGALYLVTTILTELLSNNAVAALMVPIAIGIATQLGVNMQPFVMVVMFSASAAFATPIGYQTNTYVYGVGGYRFSDFVKIGVPLNCLCFVTSLIVVPRIWPF